MKVHQHFLPHPHTHHKTKLLSWHFLVIYILLFILLRSSIEAYSAFHPGVLGIESSVTAQQIIDDTNKERASKGLSPLQENANLDNAALAKAKNMFAENYWAHFSPSGKDPWGFILNSGYKFSYAGENLARNFYTSDDVVRAWMNSPSHRDNLLNPNYQDIGVAILDGTLNGQKTTLVVQMFGKSYQPLAAGPTPQVDAGGQKATVPEAEVAADRPVYVAGAKSLLPQSPSAKASIDPYQLTRFVGLGMLSFIAFLVVLDMIILKKRGVFRLSSHHVAHLGFLAAASASVVLSKVGEIL